MNKAGGPSGPPVFLPDGITQQDGNSGFPLSPMLAGRYARAGRNDGASYRQRYSYPSRSPKRHYLAEDNREIQDGKKWVNQAVQGGRIYGGLVMVRSWGYDRVYLYSSVSWLPRLVCSAVLG